MRKGAIARRSRRPRVRGVQLSHNLSDEEDNSAPTGNEPECRNPPTVSVQRTAATKKLSVIRGWTKEDMEKAIDDVEFNGFSVRAAAKKYSIPPTSLHYWLNGLTHTKRRGPPTVLTEEEEEEIVEWCKEMADMGHGLELMQLKANVAQICETRQNPFRDGFPGKSWWAGFRKRHPDLAIRTAEGLDRDRALNLRPAIVTKFYDNLAKSYGTYSYGAHKIWNCDETGLQAGRNCGVRVIAKRGSRNVPKVIPKSREWITILCCVNAAGMSIPGFYLFKGKRMIKNYIKNCEPGACMAAHPNAWMTKELFLNWLCHFARSVPGGVSPNNRHLLIFDGHGSHVALQTVEEANKLGIDLITLPAHTSHKLQPLDVSVFSPFKTYFRAERSKWMAENKCADVKRSDIAELASRALKKAQTPSNIIAGFKRTGIWPLNYDALLNDMACSQAFDMQGEEVVDAVTNILSLSQRINPELNDSEEVVPETQFMQNVDSRDDMEAAATHGVELNGALGNPSNIINNKEGSSDFVSNNDLSLPSQVNPPQWLEDAMKNLGYKLPSSTEDQSLNLPSFPEGLEQEAIIHYYADVGDEDEQDEVEFQEDAQENEINLEVLPHEPQHPEETESQDGRGKLLSHFLRLPREIINKSDGSIRLSRHSQILTAPEYMELLVDAERKKEEQAKLKLRKKELAQEKKVARLAAKEKRLQEKLEREREKQAKEQQKEIEKAHKQQRKEQEKRERELANQLREYEKRMRVSSATDHENRRIFQDMLNIQIPGYAQIGTPPSLMNNSCTVPSWYVSPHLLSTSSSSPSSSFAMPPWMQASAGQPTPLSTTGANPFSSGQPNPFSAGGPDPLSIGQPNALSKGILNPFSVGQSNTVSAGKENPKAV
ncbi:hypothetical protein KI387_043047 [Taxus chinensis]|uniref:HTH CENPB-type domain-containing protein n=1 Tax=Taxus chinensis TaxID=29808 RepID=A0AA38C2S1_TAXCH|nr:hypothetical protein KI387_043047 [Taxus chinensis]